nr:HAMP domain-containing sensor histidine kinase [Roseovarius bejariae]
MAAAIATARRIQAPLRKTAEQLKAVAPGTPDIRLGKADLPTEFAPFVASVNAALDRLEEGYQAQRDFSSNVAHEVRTPLAVLRSTIELVENTTLRNDLLEDLERLDRLFSQLIELARADAAGERAMTTVDLNRIAIDLAAEESLRALRQNRSLAVTGAGTAPAIGHAGLLNVALGNLVRNALAHSPEGTEIEIEVLASPPGWRVYDRGPGVPDDMKPVIFDRFERGKTNAHEGGVGIGLSIVWAVMQAHGGHCRVEDRKGGGAVFTLELPEA